MVAAVSEHAQWLPNWYLKGMADRWIDHVRAYPLAEIGTRLCESTLRILAFLAVAWFDLRRPSGQWSQFDAIL